MYSGTITENDWGHQVQAPDFLDYELRNGHQHEALYRVITSGVGGTAMPTWLGALPEENLWALVHYVRSIVILQDTPEGAALARHLAEQPEFKAPVAEDAATEDSEDAGEGVEEQS
jgi:hypothetical protein